MRRPVESGGALLAGAGAGLLLMYLFDPRSGSQRRKMLRDAAMNTGKQAVTAGKQIASSAMHKGEGLYGAVRDQAAGSIDDAKHRVNLALGREHEHHYVGQSVCALSSMAMGAGVMWLFDANLGRERRQWIWDAAFGTVNQIGEFFRAASRTVVNKFRGEAEQMLDENQQGAEQTPVESAI